jgi:RNA polymerase sigma-70 factor (ECF subfamily)
VSAASNQVFVDHQNDFEGVVSRYSPVLFRVALRRLRNIEDAEDAVQDALLSAHKYYGQFQGRSKLSTWLTRIVTNAALMKLRRHSRHEMLSLGQDPDNDGAMFVSELTDARPNPETIYAQTERNETLRQALAQLSPKQRNAIQLYELDGVSMAEAASSLGISKNTMKSRVKRGRESLNLIVAELIATPQAATRVNQRGPVCGQRRSPVRHGAPAANSGFIKHRSRVCTPAFVPVSPCDEILSHTGVSDEHTDIHYPPHSLEIATQDNPQSCAT